MSKIAGFWKSFKIQVAGFWKKFQISIEHNCKNIILKNQTFGPGHTVRRILLLFIYLTTNFSLQEIQSKQNM